MKTFHHTALEYLRNSGYYIGNTYEFILNAPKYLNDDFNADDIVNIKDMISNAIKWGNVCKYEPNSYSDEFLLTYLNSY